MPSVADAIELTPYDPLDAAGAGALRVLHEHAIGHRCHDCLAPLTRGFIMGIPGNVCSSCSMVFGGPISAAANLVDALFDEVAVIEYSRGEYFSTLWRFLRGDFVDD